MDYFHGTVKGGLTELKPYASPFSNLKEPVVYLTTSRQLALHYIWDMERIGMKMPMLKICEDGQLIFQEMFSGALEYFYKGVSGYIYRCVGDYELNGAAGVHTCATSREPVPIADFEYIEDVYESILSYAQEGKFVYERYEDLPPWRVDIIRGNIMRFIKRGNLLGGSDSPSRRFVEEKFPQYWKEAQVLSAHGLF